MEAMNNRIKVAIASVVILVFVASIIAIRLPAPPGAIIVPDVYSSIQEAVDHAYGGQTVYVKSGVYTAQSITINKPLSVIGENPADTVLVGINYQKYSPGYVILVSADNVKISGFTIMNGSLGDIRVETIGSDKGASHVTITGNNILSSGIGVSNYGGDHFTIEDNNFYNNSEYGAYLGASHSTVSGNRITGNGWFGMLIDSCTDVTVTNNVISGNGVRIGDQVGEGGVCLRWSGDYRIFANNITGNFADGVQFSEGCSNSAVHDNNIVGNTVGIDLTNFAISNNSEGIGVGSGNTVYQNNLVNAQNAWVQTVFPYGDPADMYGTIGNGTDAVAWDNGVVGNFWGDYNGTETYSIDQNNTDHHPLTEPVGVAEKPLNVPPLPINPQQINQVILNVQYSGQWFGIYGGPNASTVGWGGNSTKSIVLNRPSGVSPWIIAIVT
jgi:parallel beta-helix repeat protein